MMLITTPNGNVGSEIVRRLRDQGVPLRLGAHTMDKARATFPGADVVRLDYQDLASAQAALRGIDLLYLASPLDIPPELVTRVVDLAVQAGVRHIVRLSAMGVPNLGGDNPLRQVELHIEASGVAWTFLRPNTFMQNFSTVGAEGIRRTGALIEPAGDGATSFVDARDIAAVAVAALSEQGQEGQAYDLTGPAAVTRHQVAAAISEACGREVRYVPVEEEQFQRGMVEMGAPEAVVAMLAGFYRYVRAGQTAALADGVQSVTGRAPIDFGQFARDNAASWR